MPSSHLILYHPLSPFPSVFPSISVFSNESALPIRWPKYWSFSFSISPSNEYLGLVSFKVNWFDLLLSKALSRVLSSRTVQKNQFVGTQPSLWSDDHIHTWLLEKLKLCLLWTFVDKVMSLLFNMLSRFVIAFLPRSKRLLISWLPLSSSVILEPKKMRSVTVYIFSSSLCQEGMRPDATIFVLWMLKF